MATNISTTIYVLARSWPDIPHPAVVKAVEGRLRKGAAYGMPHNMEWELAEEICTRFPIEMCRFGNSGTEATMHSVRLARAATARDKIIKFEAGYHGLHDAALVARSRIRPPMISATSRIRSRSPAARACPRRASTM